MYPINYGEEAATVLQYVAATGLDAPILLDARNPVDPCVHLPTGARSAYEYLAERIGDPNDGPFPLQILLDGAGRIVWTSRFHRPAALLEALAGLSRQ